MLRLRQFKFFVILRWFFYSPTFILILLCINALPVNAQVTTASMNGIVTDKSGNTIEGATIRVLHGPSGSQYETSTREDGRFNLYGLRIGGPYSIHVSFVGYRSQDRSDLKLELGQNLRIDFSMDEEAVQMSEVQILGERDPILSAGRTGAASNVSRDNIDRLPTISRNFTDYLKLSPYFIGNSAQGRNNRYNNIQIDGANFNDLFGLGSTGTPGLSAVAPISLEAIQEFQIALSPFDIRQSGFTGAGVNAVTRSGSNSLSGSAFVYSRNQNLVGKSPNTLHTPYADFSELQTGFRLGGSILQDKLFYLLNAELTYFKRPVKRTLGALSSGTNIYTVSQDSINLFVNTLKNQYGYEPGSFSSSTFDRWAVKILARFDFNIDENNKLILRDNFLTGYDDAAPSYSTGTYLYAENSMYQNKNTTNSLVLQLTSVFGNKMSNEFLVSYTAVRDKPVYVGQQFPFVVIRNVADTLGGKTNLVAGTEQYRIKNALDQDIVEITDNLTYFLGNHILTVGTHNEIFSFRNLYIANSYGYYQFNYLADFINGRPAYEYQLSYSLTGNPDQAAKFKAIQYGFYVQDDWNILPNLKVTAGVRIDIPTLPDKPAYNYKFDSTFTELGYSLSTNQVPGGRMMFSPRIAFNFDISKERSTQIRGGTGLFTGRVPYVWISNQYGNTGVEFARLDVFNTQAFIADPFDQPLGTVVKTSEVDITDKNFKMPQIWRSSIGIDQKLPFDFVGTIEGVWSYNLKDIKYQDINLKQVSTSSIDGRPLYGTYNSVTRRWTYAKQNSTDFTNVILLSNTGQGYSENLTVQLQRIKTTDGIDANIAYTYGVSKDINSGTSSQATSQWRYNHVVDPNAAAISYSLYDRRHRVMAAVSYRYAWSEKYSTTIGVYYSGLSGQPYSWIINGDINGDGQTSNDLAYIPKDENDIILVNSSGAVIADKNDVDYKRLFEFIGNDDYLRTRKGQIAERMGARTLWSGQVDLHISQEISIVPGHKLEVMLDILNIMNLINRDWGWVRTVGNQSATNMLSFYAYDTSGQPMYQIGNLTDPSTATDPSSRWQMQLGVSYSF